MVQKVMNRVSRAGDTSALRKQILADILGNHVEEYENFNRETADKKRQHRTRIPLWKFLLHLLHRDQDGTLIKWNKDHLLEFRINDPAAMAILWGSVKNRTDMTYEKFGRAMRYYYGKNIIEKVSGRRYSYRFVLSKRTRRYINSHFVFDLPMENETEDAAIDSCEEDNDVDEDDAINLKNRDHPVESAQAILLPARKEYKVSNAATYVIANNEMEGDIDTKLTAVRCRVRTKVTGAAGCDQASKRETNVRAVKSEKDEQSDRVVSENSGRENVAARTRTRIFKPDELLSRGINFNFDDDFFPLRNATATLLGYNLLLPSEKRSSTDEEAYRPPTKRVKLCDSILIPSVSRVNVFGGHRRKDVSFFVPPKVDGVTFCSRHNLLPLEKRVDIRDYDFLLPSKGVAKPREGSIFHTLEGTSRVLHEFAESSLRPVPALIHVPRKTYPTHLDGLYLEREQWDEGEGRCRHSFRFSTGSLSDNGSEGGDSTSSHEQSCSLEVSSPDLRRYADYCRIGFTDLQPECADSRRCIFAEESPLHMAFTKPPRTQLLGARSFDREHLRLQVKPERRFDPFIESSLTSDAHVYPRLDCEAIFRPSAL